jgi:UDP-N-acetylmuramoyl-tripeptide--D-alanyl-D-alanine ligase
LNVPPERLARGISTDSRTVKADDLFVAISGEKFDGHDFLGDVCAKGAVAAVVEERRTAALPPDGRFIVVPDARKALGAISAAYLILF